MYIHSSFSLCCTYIVLNITHCLRCIW